MRFVLRVLLGLLVLAAVGVGNWMIWNSLALRESGPWWRYTQLDSDFAEDLVGISAVVVIGLIFLAGILGWGVLLLGRRGETGIKLIVAQLLIGCLGFAVIRGVVQHWSWWIQRWDQASIFADFVCGTVMFGCIGFVAGFCIATTIMAATALVCAPLLFAIRRLFYGDDPPPLIWDKR